MGSCYFHLQFKICQFVPFLYEFQKCFGFLHIKEYSFFVLFEYV
jgi:hypothetical protein